MRHGQAKSKVNMLIMTVVLSICLNPLIEALNRARNSTNEINLASSFTVAMDTFICFQMINPLF